MKKYIKLLGALALLGFWACEDPDKDKTFTVYELEPIGLYLDSRPDDFSEWVDLLHHANLYNAVNQASNTYTVFVPDNRAMKAFYEQKRVNSAEELDKDYARELIKYHTVAITDTMQMNLESFIQGGILPYKTLTDEYLEVTFGSDQGSEGNSGYQNVYLNGQYHVGEFSIPTSNGLVYVLNDVMRPLIESAYRQMFDDGKNDILLAAMDLTGWAEQVNTISDMVEQNNGTTLEVRRYYTILAVTDEVYAQADIRSVEDLIAKLGAGSDYTNPGNALHRYVGYHILQGSHRAADFKEFLMGEDFRLWQTSAANTLIKVTEEWDHKFHFNYDGGADQEAFLIESESDLAVKNGYIHQLDGWLPICTNLKPVAVYYDVTDYSEVGSYVSTYAETQIYQTAQESEYRTEVGYANLSCYPYTMGPTGIASGNKWERLGYTTIHNRGYEYDDMLRNDFLIINLGYLGHITLTTPPILPGKYKVKVVYVYANTMNNLRTIGMEGSAGGRTRFDIEDSGASAVALLYSSIPAELAMGIYDYDLFEVEFDEISTHRLKITLDDPAASISSNYRVQIDYFLFEPIN